jgi:hypothetical protein
MYCHACTADFSIEIDMQADGNHVFNCPHCDHEHCRVVKDGKVTSERWDTRNGDIGAVYHATAYTNGTVYTGPAGTYDYFIADSWASTSTASTTTY